MNITKLMADAVISAIVTEQLSVDFQQTVTDSVREGAHVTEYGSDCRGVFYEFFLGRSLRELNEFGLKLLQLHIYHQADLAMANFIQDLQIAIGYILKKREGENEKMFSFLKSKSIGP